jgi:hypothetical protein
MAGLVRGRMAAHIEGDFVVFLIGARIHKPWKVGKWWPLAKAMRAMLRELETRPDSGFLGYEQYGMMNGVIVQYWRSFEHLERYARAKDGEHFPAWVAFNRTARTNDAVGIWHETYAVPAGSFEAVYHNCPRIGLGKGGALVPASGARETAAGRIGREDPTPYPGEAPLA